VSVTVYSSGGGGGIICTSCDGSGAILGYGTLITMAKGTKVPVQNLALGDQSLGYNTTTGKYITSTATSIVIKNATIMLVINIGTVHSESTAVTHSDPRFVIPSTSVIFNVTYIQSYGRHG